MDKVNYLDKNQRILFIKGNGKMIYFKKTKMIMIKNVMIKIMMN